MERTISTLTKTQEKAISEFLKNWQDNQTFNDDSKIRQCIGEMYESLGLNTSTPVLIFDSPMACELAVRMLTNEETQEKKGYVNIWWGAWAAMYEFGKYIGVDFPEKEYDLFVNFNKYVSFSIMFENLCVTSRKPVKIHWKGSQIHHAKEKAVEYADGWGWYAYEGVPMPEKYYATPDKPWDPLWIDQEENADVKAKLLKEIGFERWIEASEAETLDTANINDLPYKLVQKIDPSVGKMKFLHMKNPSVEGTYHLEAVPPDDWIKTCEDALRWRQIGDKARDKSIIIENMFVK